MKENLCILLDLAFSESTQISDLIIYITILSNTFILQNNQKSVHLFTTASAKPIFLGYGGNLLTSEALKAGVNSQPPHPKIYSISSMITRILCYMNARNSNEMNRLLIITPGNHDPAQYVALMNSAFYAQKSVKVSLTQILSNNNFLEHSNRCRPGGFRRCCSFAPANVFKRGVFSQRT